jgi:hypothetical protein
MISANIDIFKMDYKSTILYLICLYNLDKICCTNGPAPTVGVGNNTSFTSSVGICSIRRPECGVTIVIKIATTQPNVKIGVLEEDYTSEWASPTSAIAKKSLTVRVVSDFRKLNSLLQHQPFPIPKIGDMIRSMEGFTFATALDLNMGYYHIKLDTDAQKLCTIIFP